MNNHYQEPELVIVGRAKDVILGSSKEVENVLDSPLQDYRETIAQDDE